MKATILAALSLAVAVAALAAALLRPTAPARPTQDGGRPNLSPAESAPALEARIAAVEARLERLEEGVVVPAASPGRAPLERDPLPDDVAARLERLEERQQRLEARAWSIAELREQGFRVLRLGHDEATLDAWTAQALDGGLPVAERLAAFARLRGQMRDDGTDARLPALEGMLALARATDDPAVRAAVYESCLHLSEPDLVEPLLGALRDDASAAVRSAAALALGALVEAPGVRDALERTVEADGDETVKDAAFLAAYGQPRRPADERR